MRKIKKTASKGASIKMKAKKNPATKKQLKAAASNSSAHPSTQIPLLNDDCVLKISPYLNIKELNSMKDCSRRFSALADYAVHRRFRNKYVYLPAKETAADAASFLHKFGKIITHLQIDDDDRFIRFCNQNGLKFNSSLKKCLHLKFLRLKNVSFGNVGFEKFKQTLHNIESLELINCDLSSMHVNGFMKSCNKLKKFSIDAKLTADMCSSIIQNGHSLESIRLKKYDLSTTEFYKFIGDLKLLKNLKSIDVGRVRKSSVLPMLRALVKTNSKIKTIHISKYLPENDEVFELLKRLNYLRTSNLQSDLLRQMIFQLLQPNVIRKNVHL